MKTWGPVIVLGTLFCLLAGFAFSGIVVCRLQDYPFLAFLPYVLMAVGIVLGLFYAQSRISLICLLLGIITAGLDRALFVAPDDARADTLIFLSAIYVPLLSVLFYHSRERGMVTIHGVGRIGIVFSVVLVLEIVPRIPSLSQAVSAVDSVVLRTRCSWLQIPPMGIVILLGCSPFFLLRNKHESPVLGPLLVVAVLFAFGALNVQSDSCPEAHKRASFALFMSGAAASLILAVLESSWRNANIDELTDLPGRRSLKHRVARLGSQYAVAMVDIDHFKKINDKYGHDTGDQVLRCVAQQLKKNGVGLAYRYGGEEFVVVVEGGGSYDDAVVALDELRERIAARKFAIRGNDRPKRGGKNKKSLLRGKRHNEKLISISVSIGVARRLRGHKSPQEVMEAADKALYKAKEQGRNRTIAVR